MRRLIIAVPIVLAAGVAGTAGWHWLRPHDPLAQARQLVMQGDLRAARLVLRRTVQADPGRAEAHLRLGQLQLRLGDPIAAEREFRAAAGHGWDAHALTPLLAQAVAAQHRDAEVLRDYSGDGLAPDQAAAVLVARAQAQLGLGRPDEASASLADAQRLAPHSVATALLAARLAQYRRDPAAAERHVGEALAIDPQALDALLLQAELLTARGERSAALAGYGTAIDLATAGGSAAAALRLDRAGLLFTMGEDGRATADLDAVLKLGPKQPLARFLAARLAARAGDWRAADAALAEIGAALPLLPGGELLLAVVKAQLGQPEQARAAAERQLARIGGDELANQAATKLLARLEQATPRMTPAIPATASAAMVRAALQAGDIDQAVSVLAQLNTTEPNIPQPDSSPFQLAMLGGMVKLAQIDLAGAGAAFEAARMLDPQAAAPRLGLARVLALQDHAPAAAAMLQDVLAADPGDAAALAALVELRLAAGQPDQAVAAAYRAAHRAAPANREAAIGLGALYLRIGQPQRALDVLDGLPPEAPPAALRAQALLAQALLAVGRPADAAATLYGVLARTPDDVALRRQLAGLLAADRRYDEAQALLRDGLARRPGDAALLAADLAVAASRGGPEAALARADELAGDPASPPTLKIDLLMRQRRFAEAATSCRARLAVLDKNDPKDDRTGTALQLRLAEATAAMGDAEAAAGLLRDWLASHPGSPDAALLLAALDLAANRLPEARRRLQDVLSSQPGNPAALNNLAWISQLQGDLAGARGLAQRAYKLAATAQSADTLGWVVLAQGHPGDASALLREAASRQPGNPAIQYHLAKALARDGQKAAATAMLKAAVAQPGFDEQPAAASLLAELAS